MKKSHHGRKRQKLRLMDDYLIWKTITFGRPTPSEGKIIYQWGPRMVVMSEDETLVTCHPGDVPEETAKVLPFRINVDKREATPVEAVTEREISYEDYISDAWLKRSA